MIRTAVFGGGCFWCTEAIFKELKGVLEVKNGYSGGDTSNPTYRSVTSGTTNHAEVIEIRYDANLISFKDLALIHLTTHDPTTLNQQGADKGTQYRSIMFYNDQSEQEQILKAINEVQAVLNRPIVTQVVPLAQFYEAEVYHQDYYNQNMNRPYCRVVISPKLSKFRKQYEAMLKS